MHEPGPRPWAAIAAATMLGLPLGSIYAFSVFLRPLETLLGASRSELASIFGLSTIFFTIGCNLAPRLFGRLPTPALLFLCIATSASGVALAALARSFMDLALGYGVLFSTGGGLSYVVAQQSVNLVATRRQGLINGYLVSLFPAGAMLAAPLFGWGIAAFGVRETLAGLAVTVAVTGVLAVPLLLVSGARLEAARMDGPRDASTPAQRSVFWRLFTVFFLAAAAGLTVLSQAAGIIAAYGGATAAALWGTTGIAAAIAVARLTGGWLVDRFPIPVVAAGAHLLALSGAIVLTLVPSPETAVPTLIMIGVGYGLISGVLVGAIAFYWPKSAFGRIAGAMYIAWCAAAITLPVLAAYLFDLTGGYGTAMIVAGCGNLLGAMIAATLPRREPPPKTYEPWT